MSERPPITRLGVSRNGHGWEGERGIQSPRDVNLTISHEEHIHMEPAALVTYRQRLSDKQDQLVQRIFELEEELQHVTGRDIEYGDRAQAEAPEEVLEQLDEQSRWEWEAIQAALTRIEAGTYGDCEACGEPITSSRLEAMPMARRCVRCQEAVEKARRG